jgi:hypothetical protein
MKKQEHEELQKSFDDISKLLQDQNLKSEEREKFEILRAKLAGALMSSWLPVGEMRKIIMFFVGLVGVYFLTQAQYVAMTFSLILLCAFSPRIIGEIIAFFSKKG